MLRLILPAKLPTCEGDGQSHRMSHENDIPGSRDAADECICAIDPRPKVLLSRDNLSRLATSNPVQASPMLRRCTVPRTRGMTSSAKRCISASNGWNWSMNSSMPAAWNSRIRAATAS